MLKISRTIATAFARGESAKVQNTVTDGRKIWLHGSVIVAKDTSPDALYITLAGYNTATTRARLNDTLKCLGFTRFSIYTKQGQAFLTCRPAGSADSYDMPIMDDSIMRLDRFSGKASQVNARSL